MPIGDLGLRFAGEAHADRAMTVMCTDASGNTSSEKTSVVVSHNP
jgi:hypothetical protein